jgi:predicted ATP-dependent serine protease
MDAKNIKEYQRRKSVMKKHYCENCGKLQTEAEYLVGQCNDCDPFEDPDLLEELFGEAEYLEEDE